MADNGKKDKDKDDKMKDKEKTSKDDNENKEEGADQDKEKDEGKDQPDEGKAEGDKAENEKDEGKENEKDQDKDKAAEDKDKDKGEAAEDKDQTNEDKAEDETDKDKANKDDDKAAEGEEKDKDNPDEDKDKENADEDKNKTDEKKIQDDEKEKAEKAQAEEDEAIDKKPKLLAGDPLQETKEETEAIKEGVQTFKEGDMLKIEDVFEDLKDEQRKQNADNLINDMLAEEANHPDNIGEAKVSRKYNSGSLFAKIPFSWGNLDVYLHSRYDNINVVMRCFIECVIICVLFMFLPILLISLPPYTKSYNIFQNLSAMSKVNNYTEFFRENLFVSLCYCLFIIFSLLTDNMLVIMGYILQMFGLPIEGSVGEILQMLMSSKKHIRNSIVSILVFCLAVWLISDYEFFSHKISLCHLSMTLVFWYFLVSTIFFVESFCMNYLLSELRRKSFRGRIWDVNYKTFVFKKLAAIADASTPGSGSLNPRVRMVIRDLKNDYDTGFFLKHNDLNLTSVEQAKSIPNGIFAYLDLSDELPYDLLKKFFPSNHLEVYEYLSGNSVNKETTDFPPINYENFEAKCVDLFQERMDIARSLYDRDIILRKLDFVLFSVMFFFSAIIFLILLDVDYKVYVASIGPFFFGLGWIFQDSIKELYRCFVFLLLSHPFDCGDRVKIDNEELTVLRIDLLYSTFVTFTGKIKYIPNAAMFLKNVENYRRSDLQSEDVTITVSNNTTFVQLLRVRDKLAEFLKLNQNNFTGSIFVRNYEPDGPNMKVILSIEHTSNFQDLKPRFIRRDILLKELERVLDSESIAYNHVFVCSD